MKFNGKQRNALFFIGVVSVFLTVIYILIADTSTNPSSAESDNKHVAYQFRNQSIFSTEFYAEKIEELGMHETYKLLAEIVEDMDDYGKHLNAHQFGDALYWKKTLGGIVVCDNRFGNGCFHQLFMTALNEEGENIILRVGKACLKEFGTGVEGHACNHGIGHGIMAALGEDLERALNVCNLLESKKGFFACIDGVFMEYFTPTLLVAEKNTPKTRELNINNPDAACVSLDPKFQPTCYSMQVSWWLTRDMGAEKSGSWCENIANRNNSEACFRGLGYALVLSSRYQKDLVVQKCDEATDIMEKKILCRAGAYWGFKKGEEVGEKLSEEDKALCEIEEKKRCLEEVEFMGTGIGISAICCSSSPELL